MKKMTALVLVLVMALAVFSSCARKEEAKEETLKMSITIINKTGGTAKSISIKERIGSQKQEWSEGELANDQEITITFDTVTENGAPNLEFSFALENGNSVLVSILTKGDKVVTLTVDADGGANAEIAEK